MNNLQSLVLFKKNFLYKKGMDWLMAHIRKVQGGENVNKRHALAGIVAFCAFGYLFFSFVIPIFAAPPTSQYNPGETLDPGCSPGDTNCSVVPPVSGTGVAGRVPFFITTSTVSSTAAFYWDNTNSRLGLGTTAPSSTLHIVGGGITQSGGTNSLASTTINGNATTTNLTISGISGSTQCLRVDSNGVVSGTGAACSAGSGNVITTAANTLAGYIPAWTTNASSTLSATSSLFWDSTNDRIAVGTTTATAKLEVSFTNSIGNTDVVAIATAPVVNGSVSGSFNGKRVGIQSQPILNSGVSGLGSSNFYGVESNPQANPTFTGSGAFMSISGFKTVPVWGGSGLGVDDDVTIDGFSATVSSDLGTTGSTRKRGAALTVSGTAGDNYGLYADVAGATNNYGVYIANPASSSNNYALYSGATAKSYFAGFLGLGTTTPSSKLHIVGGAITQSGGTNSIASTTINGQATTTALSITSISGSTQCLTVDTNGKVSGTGATCGAGNGNVSVTTANTVAGYIPAWTTTASSTLSATSSLFWDSTNGRIGIGTTQPSSTLHVIGTLSQSGGVVSLASTTINGQATTTALSITGLTAGSVPFIGTNGVVSQNNANLFWDSTNARLGVGTNGPVNALSVVAGIATTSKASIAQSLTNDGGAPTTISSSSYLNIGGAEFGANSYRLITFGYKLFGTDVNSPAYIGYQETSASGRTNGDLIFGTRNTTSDVAPSERLRITTAGAVLIATTTTPTNGLFAIATSSPIFTVLSTSRVGIGTSTPATALDVVSDGVVVSSTFTGIAFVRDSTTAKGVTLGYDTATGNGALAATGGSALGLWTNNSGWGERVRLTSAGLLGIGTTAPSSTLHVVGNAIISANVTTTNLTVSSISGSTQCLQVDTNGVVSGTGSGCAGNGIAGSGTANQIPFFSSATNLTSTAALSYATTTGVFAVSATSSFTGKVGIGTATPLFPLHVSSTLLQGSTSSLVLLGPNMLIGGSASGTLLGANVDATFNGHFLNFQQNSSTKFFISSTGTVGVGTISPTAKFSIVTTSSFKASIAYDVTDSGSAHTAVASSSYLHLGGAEFGSISYRLLTFGYRLTGTDVNFPAYIGYQEIGASGRTNGDLVFGTRNVLTDTAPTERLRIRRDGTVEVGQVSQGNALASTFNVLSTSTYMVNIMRTGISGSNNAITSVGSSSSYLHLGGGEFGVNSYRLISFGWRSNGATTNFPAYMGFQETSQSGNTMGDLVFGTRDNVNDTAPTERLRITNVGNFGIGTAQPSSTLHVVGTSTLLMTTNVAIGTITPLARFHVTGTPTETASGTLILFSSSTIQGGNASGTFVGINASATFNGDLLNLQVNSSSKLRVTSSGVAFVAGGLNASSTLTVESSATFRSTLTQSGGVVSLASTTINGNATTTNLTISGISGSTQCLRVDTNGIVSGTGAACGNGNVITTAASTLAGYFPIWTTSASTTLSATSSLYWDSVNSRIGIGTTQPSSTLHVLGDINIANSGVYKLNSLTILNGSSTAATTFAGIQAGNGNTTGQYNSYLGYQAGFTNATGSQVTAVGYQAGYSNTISQNDFFGYQAGYNNTTGQNNVVLGRLAGFTNATGSFNTIAGFSAGYYNVGSQNTLFGAQAGGGASITGGSNSFFGASAGYSTTAGQINTFMGGSAGYSNTTGDSNVAVGYTAGYSNATGTGAIAIGDHAGYNNAVGEGVFIGYYAGQQQSTGVQNTFVGAHAGRNHTTGSYNTYLGYYTGYNSNASYATAVGYQAGNSNTADFNSFFGYQAGYTNSTGTNNAFFGMQAGYLTSGGSNNAFFGTNASRQNSTGAHVTSIGTAAGYNNTTGQFNTNIGSSAGYTNATGSNVTAVGYQAGNANTIGDNSFFGVQSGLNNTVGTGNTFLGQYAGYSNTTGGNNVYVGYYSAFSNSTGTQNTIIGKDAGYNNTKGGNVFIGYQAGYNATSSNELYIANSNAAIPLIYGDFLNSRIGLGTNTPDTNAKITIIGSGSSTLPSSAATVLVLGSSDGTTGGSSIRGRGTITGGLADFGEYAKVEGDRATYAQGDLLIISSSSTETFAKSSSTYQENLAGIVTETAGILAGGGDDTIEYDEHGKPINRVVIALAGRVPVKASLENGVIKHGDYLTASSKPGVAMKQTAPGATIGRAMEVFDESSQKDADGVGRVMVFVESGFSLGSGELVFATSTVVTENPALATMDRFTVAIQNAIAKLGIVIADGVAKLKEVFADKVTTKELCIDDVCVNKAQLQQLLQQGNSTGGGGSSGGGGGSTGGSDTGDGNTTTTPPTPDPTSSSTDPGTGGGGGGTGSAAGGDAGSGGDPPATTPGDGSGESTPPVDSAQSPTDVQPPVSG